jgi:hypothetical protein
MGELKHLGGYMVGTYGRNNCSKASSNITRNDLEKKSKHRPFLYWQNFALCVIIKKLKMKHILKDSIIGKMTPQKE